MRHNFLCFLLLLSLFELGAPFSRRLASRTWLKYKNPGTIAPASKTHHKVLVFRGGKFESFDTNDDIDATEDNDDDDDAELNGSPLLRGLRLPPAARDTWLNTPPVTRTFLAVSLLLTVLSSIFNNNNFPQVLEMNLNDVLQKLQVVSCLVVCVPIFALTNAHMCPRFGGRFLPFSILAH
jgi:hypothetical protein